MSLEHAWKEIVSGEKKGFLVGLSRSALGALSGLYGTVMAKRNAKYDANDELIYRSSIPVISVGNITAGGTGKTPMVAYICQFYKTLGQKPVVLTRGYKASLKKGSHVVSDGTKVLLNAFESGDEASLLASTLQTVPVVIGSSRAASAELAMKELWPDVFVLDDAFQHRRMGRDLDIVLIDATNPFGYEYVLPRGLLREPLEGLKRADVIIVTKANQISEKELRNLENRLQVMVPDLPVLLSNHQAGEVIPLFIEGENIDKEHPVFAVTAIGSPASFHKTLEQEGYEVGMELSFPDHHVFTEQEIASIFKTGLSKGMTQLVITEKDAVKWRPLLEGKELPMKVSVLPICIHIWQGETLLQERLRSLVERV